MRNAGWADTEEDYNYLAAIFEGLKDRKLVIEREPEAEQTPQRAPTGEEIPF